MKAVSIMNLFGRDDLRSKIKKNADRLIEKSLATSDKINETDRKKLDQLIRLAEIRDQFRSSIELWATLSILIVSLISVSLLMALRLEQTQIELDLTVSGFNFTSAPQTSQVLSEGFNVTDISISGINQLTLPAVTGQGPENIQISTLEILPLSTAHEHGVLTVGTLLLPGETQVSIKYLEKSGDYSIRFQDSPIDIILTVMGSIELRYKDSPNRQVSYNSPKQINVKHSSTDIKLDIDFFDKLAPSFNPIKVTNLSFISVEQYENPDGDTITWKQGTLMEGSIYFADLKGKKMTLRHGEQLRVDKAEGSIAPIKLRHNDLSFKFYGKVSGLRTGPQDHYIDLMPTWLENLKSNHFFSLFWGTATSLFCLIFSIFKWFRKNW